MAAILTFGLLSGQILIPVHRFFFPLVQTGAAREDEDYGAVMSVTVMVMEEG